MFSFWQIFSAFFVLFVTTTFVALVGQRFTINLRALQKEQEGKIEEVKKEAQKILEEAKNTINDVKRIAHEENEQLQLHLKRTEALLNNKEALFEKKFQRYQEMKSALDGEVQFIKHLRAEIQQMQSGLNEKLITLSGTSKEALKTELIESFRQQILATKETRLMKSEAVTKATAQRLSQEILIEAIQRYSSPTSSERKSSTIKIPRDEIKGQFLSKDGENLRYFEELSKVDVIFNDMPKTINVSAFDLVKRHIASRALEELVKKKSTITKEIIEKSLLDAEKETDSILIKTGLDVAKKLELKNISHDFARIIGRLNFRTSYGQNILKHSFEVASLATTLACELGVDVEKCRLAAFFHDIGKAIDQESEKPHDELSKEILERFGFHPDIVYAAYAHHDRVPANTIPALIVKAADAISAGRPGARQESLEKYLERLRALEETVLHFSGIKKTFAISAGREVRVIVDPEQINDIGVKTLAKDIAHKIEEDLTYPGQIKVNVIRKTRAQDYAN